MEQHTVQLHASWVFLKRTCSQLQLSQFCASSGHAALPGLKVCLVPLTHETKYASATIKFVNLLDPQEPPSYGPAHNSSSPSIHPSEFHSNITHLQNALQQISSWMTAILQIFSLSTLLKLSFFLLDLNNNYLKYITPLTTAHSARNLGFIFDEHLPSPTKSLHFLNLLSYHIRELRCIGPYLDFTTANTIATSVVHSKLDYCNSITTFQTINLTGSNRSRTLLLVLSLRLLNLHISLSFSNLSIGLTSVKNH